MSVSLVTIIVSTIPILHHILYHSPSVPSTIPFPFCTKDYTIQICTTDYTIPLLHQTIPFPFCTTDYTIPHLYQKLHHSPSAPTDYSIRFPFCTKDYTIPLLHQQTIPFPFCTKDYTIPLLYPRLHHSPSVPKTLPFPFCTTVIIHSASQTRPFPFCTNHRLQLPFYLSEPFTYPTAPSRSPSVYRQCHQL